MKIIIDARFFGTETGIGRYVKEVVEGLEQIDDGNQYVIFLRKENWDYFKPVSKNFTRKLVDINWYTVEEQLRLGKIIDEVGADLCHFPHFNIPLFLKTPFVVTIHDLILRHFPTTRASTLGPLKFYLKYLAYNFLLARAIKRSKKIIVPSYFVRNDVIKAFKVNPDKVAMLYEGLSNLPKKVDFGKEYLKKKGVLGCYILYVGNSYPHKNLENLIRGFKKIKEKNLQLVLVGKRDYFSKRLEEWAKKEFGVFGKKYPEDICFYGYVSDDELVTLYKNARGYVFPSFMEGFGLPPLEAISFGVPVLVSDIPVFHEVLGDYADYFNPKSPGDIARGIDTLVSGVDLKRKFLYSRFSWDDHVSGLINIYNKVL